MFFDNVIDFDRPILIKGKELRVKIEARIQEISKEIEEIIKTLQTEYAQCLEGTIKAQQKRDLAKKANDLEIQKIWLNKLLNVIQLKKNYALTLTEAVGLKIIE